ncbi:MAG TPA: YqhA family protein [Methanoregulaceae archaeon]|nr:YqhA family protein [Methanoregulaceae archaeon]
MDPVKPTAPEEPGEPTDTCNNRPGVHSFVDMLALSSRYLFSLAVIGTGMIAVVLFAYGFLLSLGGVFVALRNIYNGIANQIPHGSYILDLTVVREYLAASIEIIDIFLIATVFYLISLGLYELFIAKAPLPGWVAINNLDDLKTKLLSLTVIALAVIFLGTALTLHVSTSLVEYGIAIGIMIAAISLYVWVRPH